MKWAWARWLIEGIALILLIVAAIQARTGLPTIPLSTWDSWGFLNPALSWLSGDGFQQTNGRDWFYPGLLALFYKTTGGYAGILQWQQALAIATVPLMAITWRVWVSLLPMPMWGRLLATLVGVIPIWMQSINPQTVVSEVLLRPEAILPFFVYAQLACVMGYCRYRWVLPRGPVAAGFAAGALFLAYACLLLKPSWLFAVPVTVAPMVIGLFGSAISLRSRWAGPVVGALLSLVILWLPPKLWYIKDSASITFLPSTLFTVHADLMEKQLSETIRQMPDSDPEKLELQNILTYLQQELEVARTVQHNYKRLGFDPDYLYYQSDFLVAVYNHVGGDNAKFRSFCIGLYLKAAMRNPLGFIGKTLRQYTHFLQPDAGTFYRTKVNVQKEAVAAVESLQPQFCDRYRPEIRDAFRAYHQELQALAPQTGTLERKTAASYWSKTVAKWALPTAIIFLVAFVFVLVWAPLSALRLGGWAALLLWAAPAANAFTVAVVHALDIARYRYSYGGILLFALTSLAVFILLAVGKSVHVLVGRYLSPRP